jgi:glycerophosphoryl diester phosphodiesterase
MKIYAHRGYSQKFPEATKTAYLEAVKAGADGFECDVRLTSDKKIVCFHDRTLKRIANKPNSIAKSSLGELKNLIDILTLDELLNLAIEAKKDLLIETKHPVRSRGEIEKAVIALLESKKAEIKEAGIEIIAMSFSYLAVHRLRKIYPNVMKVVKYRFALWANTDSQVAVNKDLLVRSKSAMSKLQTRRVFMWTVNDEFDLQAIKQYADINVITDSVEKAKKALKPSAGI